MACDFSRKIEIAATNNKVLVFTCSLIQLAVFQEIKENYLFKVVSSGNNVIQMISL